MRIYTPLIQRFSVLVLLISVSLTSTCAATTQLLLGSIQFPASLKNIPMPRIYHMGKIIASEIRKKDKKITFDVPKEKRANTVYLLITESIGYTCKKDAEAMPQQTIEYLNVPSQERYEFYALTLMNEQGHHTQNRKNDSHYYWIIQPLALPETGKIPDEALIVLYPPSYIDSLSGGAQLELPTIKIKPDVVEHVGSEDNIHMRANTLQCAALDINTIHEAPIKQVIKRLGQCTLVAPRT
jgi:hypothetical protein